MAERWTRFDGGWHASGGRYIWDAGPGGGPGQYTELVAGAVLPQVSPLPTGAGTVLRWVAPDGDDGNPGTRDQPKRTLQAAMNAATPGYVIVMRGGVYSMAEQRLVVNRDNVTVRAEPGEIPIIDGSVPVSSATADGVLRHFPYTSLKAKFDAEGVNLTIENFYPPAQFSAGQPTGLAADRGFANVTSAVAYSLPVSQTEAAANTNPRVIVGAFPDQCWAGGQPLTQVFAKSLVREGCFWVERTTGGSDPENAKATRIFVHENDWDKGIDVSVTPNDAQPFWCLVSSDFFTLSGIRVQRHSSHKAFFALQTDPGITGLTVEDVEFLDTANTAIKLYGDQESVGGAPTFTGNRLVSSTTLRRVSVVGAGWLGMSAQYTDDTLVTGCRFENINRYAATDQSPKSGAIKASKNHRFTIEHTLVKGCHDSHGLWFDQSNYDCTFASNEVNGVGGSPIFWEISHKALIVNNLLIKGNNIGLNLRVSGGSGTRIINNTIVGGATPLYVIAELRGQLMGNGQWFAEQDYRYTGSGFQYAPLPATPPRAGLSSDLDRARPGERFAEFANAQSVGNLTPGMHFIGGADEVVNNVIVHNAYSGQKESNAAYYRSRTSQAGVNVDASDVFPTLSDGNVYQSVPGRLAAMETVDLLAASGNIPLQTTIQGWRDAQAHPYYSYTDATGRDARSIGASGGYADPVHGAPTTLLQSLQGTAAIGPSDAAVTAYIPAGNRHFGSFLLDPEVTP